MEVLEPFYTDVETAARLALSMYLGEKCKYCDKLYETLEDLEDTVWAGEHENGRLACRSCWEEHNR